jgi:hypothetical protein
MNGVGAVGGIKARQIRLGVPRGGTERPLDPLKTAGYFGYDPVNFPVIQEGPGIDDEKMFLCRRVLSHGPPFFKTCSSILSAILSSPVKDHPIVMASAGPGLPVK